MEEKEKKEAIVIEPAVKQYHVLGFNRTVVRDLMENKGVMAPRAIPMGVIRSSTLDEDGNGTSLSDKTVKRWQQGEDIYLSVLLNVCDELRLDPLRWICVDGEPLKSSLEDLYRLEQSGTDCATLLRERGIEPADYTDHKPIVGKEKWSAFMADREVMKQEWQYLGKEYERNRKARSISAMDNMSIIHQVAQIQREAFEHENRSVAAIRREYQNLLAEANMRAGAAENEVRRLREELRRMNEMLAHIHEGGISDLDDTPSMSAADDAKRE